MIKIQAYTQEDAQAVTEIFYQAVYALDTRVYTDAQKSAWAPLPIDDSFWAHRLACKKPFLAKMGDKTLGFIELDADGHIDCLYVHPQWQRQGIAAALYYYVLQAAKRKKMQRLYVEASLAAQPFFLKQGFKLIKKNHLDRRGQVLINFSMELILLKENYF